MTRFYPLYVRRSDGKLETIHARKKEKNEPTPEQLNSTPDANGVSDYYRAIAEDEVKHLDWRRKLGMMLIREIGGPEQQQKNYMLAAMPENYRLYEHIKSKASDGDPATRRASKNHAGGGHDRQDAYLYGHPLGRKKRFRSPADFFPHLLWLATDKNGDPNNCTCKLCCPEELQEDKSTTKDPRQAVKKEGSSTPVLLPSTTASNIPAPIKREPSAVASRPPSSHGPNPPKTATPPQNQNPTVPPASRPASATPAQRVAVPSNGSSNINPNAPSPLVRLPLPAYQLDTEPNFSLFRPGEVVWFNRGDTWGLGAIMRRYVKDVNGQSERNYIVQPLSHPGMHPSPVRINQERLLRPWLSWSPPPLCTSGLHNQPNLTYDNINWPAVVNGQFGKGNPEVDGSILAAKSIDGTFTVSHLVSNRRLPNGPEERRWGSMYLGAEKIWVGEPVRVRINLNTPEPPILLITDIIEHVQQGYNGQASRASMTIVGDLYTLSPTLPAGAAPPPSSHLPARMVRDMQWRNQIAASRRTNVYMWKLLKPRHSVGLEAVKGRWYETGTVLPIVLGEQEFRTILQSNQPQDVSFWMNARGDCTDNKQGLIGARKPERRDALGRAVPSDMRILDGADIPTDAELQALLRPHTQENVDAATFVNDGMGDGMASVDEFMNLEGIGDGQDLGAFSGDAGFAGHGYGSY
ncbi:uncharacterized protein K452DRAFT_285968 [Aplosporella prunicola CBS 121167]|uniref:Cryptic loci regulator 2 N-terminal domain-containing protein n=1 Tax=Aplosporella prunicola CBS 121167 TaxID=1176127 RepID=A0A6A6BIG5_9PEZI|nr:uncharacterized protein K452DRAFT_285968 [Aplosporella prunicola CBS 121167]KAF2143929.1 hypothetical protein K452DRAFT_285968 [Aplosporella prunicola CBS 121167]